MKSKITLIILFVLLIVACGIAIFFGYMYFNEKATTSDMSLQIEELNTQINDLNLENEELNVQDELSGNQDNNFQTQQPIESSIDTKVYYNDDNTLILYLIENTNPQYVANSREYDVERRFIFVERTANGIIAEESGYYLKNDTEITLALSQNEAQMLNSVYGANIKTNSNGHTDVICTLDNNDIILGTETLTIK